MIMYVLVITLEAMTWLYQPLVIHNRQKRPSSLWPQIFLDLWLFKNRITLFSFPQNIIGPRRYSYNPMSTDHENRAWHSIWLLCKQTFARTKVVLRSPVHCQSEWFLATKKLWHATVLPSNNGLQKTRIDLHWKQYTDIHDLLLSCLLTVQLNTTRFVRWRVLQITTWRTCFSNLKWQFQNHHDSLFCIGGNSTMPSMQHIWLAWSRSIWLWFPAWKPLARTGTAFTATEKTPRSTRLAWL